MEEFFMNDLRIDPNNLSIANQSTQNSGKKSGASSAFAALLAQRKSSVLQDLEDMNQVREEIRFNQNLHEELTGERVDDPIDDSSAITSEEIETIKHILPDGSVRILQMQGNQIISQITVDADDVMGQMLL